MGEHHEKSDPGTPHPSMDRGGEDVAKEEREPGRSDGPSGPNERPSGTSSARDYTGVDPQEPRDGGSPAG